MNLVPRAFSLKNGLLREKPWGRGCYEIRKIPAYLSYRMSIKKSQV